MISLSFYGYISSSNRDTLRMILADVSIKQFKSIILRMLYNFLSDQIEIDTKKAILNTVELLQTLTNKEYHFSELTVKALEGNHDLLITRYPTMYYLYQRKYESNEIIDLIEIYDEFLEKKKEIEFPSFLGQRSISLYKGTEIHIHNNVLGEKRINPQTFEVEDFRKYESLNIGEELYEDKNKLFLKEFVGDSCVSLYNKETQKTKSFLKITDNVEVYVDKDYIWINHYFNKYIPSDFYRIYPYVFDHEKKKVNIDIPKLREYVLKIVFKSCFRYEPITEYLQKEELVRLAQNNNCLSIEFLKSVIDRICLQKLGLQGKVWPFVSILNILSIDLGFNTNEDICIALLNIIEHTRYSLEFGFRNKFMFGHKVIYFRFKEIIENSLYSAEKIRTYLLNEPSKIFKQYYQWQPEEDKEYFEFL